MGQRCRRYYHCLRCLVGRQKMSDASQIATPIRVLLADDHDILRQGLKLLLGLQPDMQVVGEARTGQEALELAHTLSPDVVVMDISMAVVVGLGKPKRRHVERSPTQS